uniref:Uncharacterized protein n=1 Tax=Rhodnius prolixus TaxID=13249 RepID=T1HRD2_RHOPR
MNLLFKILILIAAVKTIVTQDGFTDENRPYEFGFNIEGYQHRHEKKDEKGIIMGEFGFITADGVYHLTVYATDENGNFKILKMKNTYIGLRKTQQQGKTEYPNFQQNKNLPVANADKNVKFPKQFETNVGLINQNVIAKNQFGKDNKFSDPFNKLGRTLDKEKINVNNDPNSKYHFKKMNVSDLMAILYKFNYTLTYHGHNEMGNRAGEKNGSYFFNGRDGFGRDVKYLANEFGYQPNITLVELNINDTPKEETEKELTKLLGNEFIWYY